MIDDITQHIDGVRRQVGSRAIEAGQAGNGAIPAGQTVTATISRSYEASIDDVWEACTNGERLPRWFLPIAGDLRVGGRYQLAGNAGGTIERCDPPNSLAATWEYDGDVSWVDVRLVPEPNGRTRFELRHTMRADDAKWAEFGPGAVGVGWDLGLMALSLHLESGRDVDRQASGAWMASGLGAQFMALSSQAWCDANVAAGADRSAAKAAADRTTAAYTAPAPAA